jgi:hypothetical protein
MTFLCGREEVMMFHRIQQYELIYRSGRWYRPRAYGDRQPDGTWDGWLIFFPIDGSTAIAPPGPETTQSTWAVLVVWAADLTLAYLEGALARALRLAQRSLLIDQLADAEYEALEDAERLERSAEVERTAASAARADAKRIRRQRLDTERALAATEEAAAKREANVLAQAAREARAVAADAARRRRSTHAQATPRTHTKRRGDKKYWSR